MQEEDKEMCDHALTLSFPISGEVFLWFLVHGSDELPYRIFSFVINIHW